MRYEKRPNQGVGCLTEETSLEESYEEIKERVLLDFEENKRKI